MLDMREMLRTIDTDNNGRMAFLEYLIYKFDKYAAAGGCLWLVRDLGDDPCMALDLPPPPFCRTPSACANAPQVLWIVSLAFPFLTYHRAFDAVAFVCRSVCPVSACGVGSKVGGGGALGSSLVSCIRCC